MYVYAVQTGYNLMVHAYNTHMTRVEQAVHTHTTGMPNTDTSYQNMRASMLSMYTHLGC